MLVPVVVNAQQTLGSAAGRTYPLNNFGPAMLGCIHILLTTSATAGNRTIVARILDAAGNALYDMQAANVAASLTARISFGVGASGAVGGNFQVVTMPDMGAPALAQVQVFDSAAVDVADTIQVTTTTMVQ